MRESPYFANFDLHTPIIVWEFESVEPYERQSRGTNIVAVIRTSTLKQTPTQSLFFCKRGLLFTSRVCVYGCSPYCLCTQTRAIETFLPSAFERWKQVVRAGTRYGCVLHCFC